MADLSRSEELTEEQLLEKQFEQEQLRRHQAWKYVGYPGFSRFVASSTDCFALRKFSDLNVRVLLKLQNDIVKLEDKLMKMDARSMSIDSGQGGCGSFRLDESTPRGKVLDAIAEKIKDYNERLNQYLLLQDRPTASKEQLRNLRTWLENYPNAIEKKEQKFLEDEYDKDLITARTAQHTPFGRWMQSLGLSRLARLPGITSSSPTWYYDRDTWKSIGAFVLLFIMLMMLLAPLWCLPFANDSAGRLAIVTSFTLAFSLLVVIGTTLRTSQRMILVVGYFIQLVLVLGLTSPWPSGDGSARPGPNSALAPMPSTLSGTQTSGVSIATATSTATTNVPQQSTAHPSSTPTSLNKPETPISSGLIAGIVISVCVVALLIAGALWYFRRRSRRRHAPFKPNSFEAETPHATRTKNLLALNETTVEELDSRRLIPPEIDGSNPRHELYLSQRRARPLVRIPLFVAS
ncbi:hypothetical protein AC578_3654 [Pseudocercospora eumusae]|uniref:DUF6594 domain-containing protein n=1 Tax=Pseudocercospora eumusae TaxID=321146 RepID=A0A139GX91_9PEZI|nr:hypothetical protein AC578_3654 [Pseudocercospora eumusae]